MYKSTSIGYFAWRGLNRLALILAAASLPAAAQVGSAVNLLSAPNPVVQGQSVTFTAAVNGTATAAPTGTITLTSTVTCSGASTSTVTTLGTITIGPATSAAPGGTLAVSSFPCTGANSIVASYSGDSNYLPSMSQPRIETVLAQFTPTLTTLNSSLNPSPAPQTVRFTAQLQYAPAGAYPTGTVTFKYADTGNLLGTANLQTFGSTAALTTQATIAVSSLSAGSYAVQASYSGDNVYAPSTSETFKQVLTPPSGGLEPTINQVVNGGSYLPGIQAGAWVTIGGFGLANVADPGVNGLPVEISNGVLPTSLDSVSVTINGKNAYVAFINRQQINVQAPDDSAQGPVSVVVTNHSAVSAFFTAQLQPAAPGLFQWGATNYAIVTRFPDYAHIGNPSAVPGTLAAKPGDILTLWATGLGPTQPPGAAGKVVTASAPTASPVTVTVGNMGVNVIGAATTSASVGLYQVAIQLPQSIGLGDQPVVVTVAGFQSATGVNLFIANQ